MFLTLLSRYYSSLSVLLTLILTLNVILVYDKKMFPVAVDKDRIFIMSSRWWIVYELYQLAEP